MLYYIIFWGSPRRQKRSRAQEALEALGTCMDCHPSPEEIGRGDDAVGSPHRAQMSQFELFELVLLLKVDRQLPVERFEAAVSQQYPPPLLGDALRRQRDLPGGQAAGNFREHYIIILYYSSISYHIILYNVILLLFSFLYQ